MSPSTRFICIILLSFYCQKSTEAFALFVAKDAFEFVLSLVNDYKVIVSLFEPKKTVEQEISEVDVRVFNKLNSISTELQHFKEDLLNKVTAELPSKLIIATNELNDVISKIQDKYDQFVRFVKDEAKYPSDTQLKFAEIANGLSDLDLPQRVKQMYEKLISNNIMNENIFSILADKSNHDLMCIKSKSLQQIINEVFTTVVNTDIQALFVRLYAYDYVERANNVNKTEEKNMLWEEFVDRTNTYFEKMKQYLTRASREIWKCDAVQQELGVTYLKLDEVFQTFVNNERDIVNNSMLRPCANNCEDYNDNVFRSKCVSDFCKNDLRSKQRCDGHFRNCKLFTPTKDFCISPDYSDRRYEWMETSNGIKYGRQHSCESVKNFKLIEKTERQQHLLDKCDYCVCTCVSEDKKIDRYFSLREATSDVSRNMVVTGVRFYYQNYVFYIQVQHAKLLSNGSIDPETVDWKPANYSIIRDHSKIDSDVANESDFYAVDYDQKVVLLDDIEPKPESSNANFVVTGLRLRQDEKALRLEVQTTAFDFATGQLGSESNWFANDLPWGYRTQLKLDKPNDPFLEKNHIPDSTSGQFVEFQTTDMEKDFGQYTVPFIDLQEVTSDTPLPLAGAGIFHKGKPGSGGFLGLKIIQYDFTKHF